MVVSVCPAANVAAPVEDVWELLAQPANYDRWWDAHLVRSVPEGPVTPGQINYATTKALGKQWDVTLPPGWMGWLIEHFGAGMLHRGVEDSLARLKRAAEARHGEGDPSLRSE
jgi:hypothetical protein